MHPCILGFDEIAIVGREQFSVLWRWMESAGDHPPILDELVIYLTQEYSFVIHAPSSPD